MARRHLQLTIDINLDDQACRDHDIPQTPDGDSTFTDSLAILKADTLRNVAAILAAYDPQATANLIDLGIGPDTPIDTTF